MGIQKIYLDNLKHPSLPEERSIDITLSESPYIWNDLTSHICLKEVLDLLPWVLENNNFNRLDDDEITTIIIETSNNKYTKVIDPYGNIILENLESLRSGMNCAENEALSLYRIRKFYNEIAEHTGSLTMLYVPVPFPESLTKILNSVIPAVFHEVSEVTSEGGAIIRGHTIDKDSMGGGYNQMLRILYAIWLTTIDETYTVYLNYWYNHLHPLVKKWVWTELLTKLKNIKGTLIVEDLWSGLY
jgi:hypothetical protein